MTFPNWVKDRVTLGILDLEQSVDSSFGDYQLVCAQSRSLRTNFIVSRRLLPDWSVARRRRECIL
jgi:hypothetical protein